MNGSKRFSNLIASLRARELLASPVTAGLLLLIISVLSYGLTINRLGFFWDAWPMNWIGQTRGTSGLAQYFSTNRPVWGLLYQFTLPLLGGTPLPWQVFAIFWRWLATLAFWGLLRLVWPRLGEMVLGAALLFAVYPGFQQQSIALLYSHFFIVMTAFLASLACSLLAVRHPKWSIPIYVVGLLLSAANLLMLEYFFLLELLRPILLWFALQPNASTWKIRVRRWLPAWAPYLAVFLGAVIWRVFFFPYQTNNYKLDTFSQFAAQPLQTAGMLAQRIVEEIWISTGQAWIHASEPPVADSVGEINVIRYLLIITGTIIAVCVIGIMLKTESQPSTTEKRQILLLALAALGFAGWPFWLTNVPFSLEFAYDRFTLPFMLGACLLFSGLIALIPWRPLRWLALAVMVGLGTGYQYHKGLDFRQDWVNQQQFFWQLSWRVPRLEPGTVIFANENNVTAYSTDNSLSAPLNWIYDPTNRSQTIQYLLVYPTVRKTTFSSINTDKNSPVSKDLLIGNFTGSVSQSISIYFDGFSCLRVLDPVLDALNSAPEDALRNTMKYTNLALIRPLAEAETGAAPLPHILGQPPAASWCKLYETSDLLRQSGKWYNILQLWDKERDLYNQAGNPAELSPFIEAYARTGQWDEAAKITTRTLKTRPVLCALWQQLDQTTPLAATKSAAVRKSLDLLSCSEYGILASQP